MGAGSPQRNPLIRPEDQRMQAMRGLQQLANKFRG